MRVFLKLGGSLITDKSKPESPRIEEIRRAATEISTALAAADSLSLLIGHGSGSFGHTAAARHDTHRGVARREEWLGFAEVAALAKELNGIVVKELRDSGVPAMTFQPSASADSSDGKLKRLSTNGLIASLDHGLVPVVYGDVSFDTTMGGTIISTEDILAYLAPILQPDWILLVGDYPGVLDERGNVIKTLSSDAMARFSASIGAASTTDVTGGMHSKVKSMIELCKTLPNMAVQIFSGTDPGQIEKALLGVNPLPGTTITA